MPKQPRAVFDRVFAFPPNRDTLGGTAYLIVEKDANVLIDAPPWNEETQTFLQQQGGVRSLFITHRDAIAQAQRIQAAIDCEIVVQEQEAYLLPEATVSAFGAEVAVSPQVRGVWTPGHTPGSSCAYYEGEGGVLFSGRHLLPNRDGAPEPLRTAKTFHWRRQLKSVAALRDRFSPDTLAFICPGASTGFLRGKRAIPDAYRQLQAIDLAAVQQVPPLM